MKKIILFFILFIPQLEASSIASNCRDAVQKLWSRSAWANPGHNNISEWIDVYNEAKQNNSVDWGALALTKLMILNSQQLNLSKSDLRSLKRIAKVMQKSIQVEKFSKVGRSLISVSKDLLWANGPFFFRPILGTFATSLSDQFPSDSEFASKLGIEAESFFQDSFKRLADRNSWKITSAKSVVADLLRPAIIAGILSISGMHPIDRLDAYNIADAETKKYAREKLTMNPLELAQIVQKDSGAFSADRKPVFFVDEQLLREKRGTTIGYETNPLIGIAELAVLEKDYGVVDKKTFASFKELDELFQKYSSSKTIIVMFHGLASIADKNQDITPLYGEGVSNQELLSKNITKFQNGIFSDGTILIIASCQAGDRGYNTRPALEETWVLWSYWLSNMKNVVVYAPVNNLMIHSVPRGKTIDEAWEEWKGMTPNPEKSKYFSISGHGLFEETLFKNLGHDLKLKGSGLAHLHSLEIAAYNSLIPEEVKRLGVRALNTQTGIIRHIPLVGPALPDQNVFAPKPVLK